MEKLITKIEVGKKNKNRVNIYLDEQFAFACSTDLVYYYKLAKGTRIDEEFLDEIVKEDNYLKGKNYALKLLEKGYKSEKEIYDKLISKEYNEKSIAKIMSFLREYEFVDDKRYCKLFVNERLYSYGRNKIKYLLMKKGINNEIIEYTINNIDENIEKEGAVKLAEKKYNSLITSEKNYKKLYKKIGDYLLNRGYNYDIVSGILNNIIRIEDTNNDNTIGGDLQEVAEKRYRIICKSEKDPIKIYRKLSAYLMRRGYHWEDIKNTLKGIVENE
ncbi:recombination regulator RecX [Clostridium botulinum]|uniref:recombination regulator RecX n=1 Tax=Clostridium botulinum TaxID=1491 RepID=UPI0004D361DB|nr:recombination regulator RecX [Clostridium botulinum]KEI07408.1 recombination regulator RecX [Clostridium botulinum C/D str. BKT75002]KEI10146.1 recombination regulator RecX [Clostridium botulinum C/D str. BKT2873]QPW59845.1 recombination regulator RecX [Clostridium botulinum]